jgi:hypothetical protein
MEGGILTIFALLLFAPVMMWAERTQKFRLLPEVEQNLQRASHGFVLVTFLLVAIFWANGWRAVLGFFPQLVSDPHDSWPVAIVLGGLFGYGLVRFVVGARRSWGLRDGLLAFRALFKLAAGIAGSVFLYRAVNAGAFGSRPSLPAALLCCVLMGISVWCVAVGTVRVVLTVGFRRRPKAPTPHPAPRGAAGDASPDEAQTAMRGHGGEKINLDDRRF